MTCCETFFWGKFISKSGLWVLPSQQAISLDSSHFIKNTANGCGRHPVLIKGQPTIYYEQSSGPHADWLHAETLSECQTICEVFGCDQTAKCCHNQQILFRQGLETQKYAPGKKRRGGIFVS